MQLSFGVSLTEAMSARGRANGVVISASTSAAGKPVAKAALLSIEYTAQLRESICEATRLCPAQIVATSRTAAYKVCIRSASSNASSGGGRRKTFLRKRGWDGGSGWKMQDEIWWIPVDTTSLTWRQRKQSRLVQGRTYLTATPARSHP
jgi:hypothetical protein